MIIRPRLICFVCGKSWPVPKGARPLCEIANKTPRHLSDSEIRLFVQLRGHHFDSWGRSEAGDVPIRMLYRALTKRWPAPTMTLRQQQQYVGPFLSRMNAKLESQKLRAVPGVARNTYRFVTID